MPPKRRRKVDVKAGDYYRRTEDGVIVKILHPEVFPHECSCGSLGWECFGDGNDNEEVIVYRERNTEPPRSRFIEKATFADNFEGPLDWDTALKEFK